MIYLKQGRLPEAEAALRAELAPSPASPGTSTTWPPCSTSWAARTRRCRCCAPRCEGEAELRRRAVPAGEDPARTGRGGARRPCTWRRRRGSRPRIPTSPTSSARPTRSWGARSSRNAVRALPGDQGQASRGRAVRRASGGAAPRAGRRAGGRAGRPIRGAAEGPARPSAARGRCARAPACRRSRRFRPAGATRAPACSARPPPPSTPCAPSFGSRSWRRRAATRRARPRACAAPWSSRPTRKTSSSPTLRWLCPRARCASRHLRPRSAVPDEPRGVAIPLPARGRAHAGGRHDGGGGSPAASRRSAEPDRPLTLLALGFAHNSRRRHQEAKDGPERTLDFEPDNLEAIAALAEAEEGLRRDGRRAGPCARRRWHGSRGHATANLVMGLVLMKQERYAEARDALHEGGRRGSRLGQGPLPAEPGLRPPGGRGRLARAIGRSTRRLKETEERIKELRRGAAPSVGEGMRVSQRRRASPAGPGRWRRRRRRSGSVLFRDIAAEAGHHLHAPRGAREEVHRRVDERRRGALRLRQRRPPRHLLRRLPHRGHRPGPQAPRAARSTGTWAAASSRT